MSVSEMKQKVHDLIEKQENAKKLNEILQLLQTDVFREVTAQEVVAEMNARYSETFRRLAQ
ncbi:MAG: hypothetical protein ABIX01_03175 [Chitinophagaceae bacterium]